MRPRVRAVKVPSHQRLLSYNTLQRGSAVCLTRRAARCSNYTSHTGATMILTPLQAIAIYTVVFAALLSVAIGIIVALFNSLPSGEP